MKLKNEMFSIVGGDADHVQIELNARHLIYQAHFPGNPITPGVCIVQIIGELLQDRVARKLSLTRVVNLKFVSTISPVESPVVEICFSSVEDSLTECKAKGTIMSDGKVKTKFSLVFAS